MSCAMFSCHVPRIMDPILYISCGLYFACDQKSIHRIFTIQYITLEDTKLLFRVLFGKLLIAYEFVHLTSMIEMYVNRLNTPEIIGREREIIEMKMMKYKNPTHM